MRAVVLVVLVLGVVACGASTQQPAGDATPSSTAVTSSSPSSSSAPPPTSGPSLLIRGFGEPISIPAGLPGTEDAAESIPAASALAVSDTGVVAVGSERGTLRLADVGGALLQVVEHAHEGAVTSAAFVPGEDELFTGSEDGTIIRWTRSAGSWEGTPFRTTREAGVKDLAISPAADVLAVADVDGVDLVELPTGSVVDGWSFDRGESLGVVLSLAFPPDWSSDPSSRIAASTDLAELLLIDRNGVAESYEIDSAAASIAFMPQGDEVLVSGTSPPTVFSLTSRSTAEMAHAPASGGRVDAVAVWAGGEPSALVAAAGDAGNDRPVIDLFVADAPEEALSSTGGLSGGIVSLAFTHDARSLVVAARDRVVIIPLLST